MQAYDTAIAVTILRNIGKSIDFGIGDTFIKKISLRVGPSHRVTGSPDNWVNRFGRVGSGHAEHLLRNFHWVT